MLLVSLSHAHTMNQFQIRDNKGHMQMCPKLFWRERQNLEKEQYFFEKAPSTKINFNSLEKSFT